MDLVELLRFQAGRYRCPACGKNMADCRINLVEQHRNRSRWRTICTYCNDENMLQIELQTDTPTAPFT